MGALVLAFLGARWWHRHHKPVLVQSQPWISCAQGKEEFAVACSGDLDYRPDGLYLTLARPDGSFHRLLVTKDGHGVVAADGAEPARVTPVDADTIEVAIADMRYRLPAKVVGRQPGKQPDTSPPGTTTAGDGGSRQPGTSPDKPSDQP